MVDIIQYKFIKVCALTAEEVIKVNSKFAYRKKYSHLDYFKEIFTFMRNCVYWSRYKGKIKGKTLNKMHNIYVKQNIYELAYRKLLEIYYMEDKLLKLKNQSTDTLFIKNKQCVNVGRNKFYKNKRGIKVSVIIDSLGIPISLSCVPGNTYDTKTIPDLLNNRLIETDTEKYARVNKYKQSFLTDPAYDSAAVRDELIKNGYTPVIDFNKRNTKNLEILKKKRLTRAQKTKYNKRSKVENCFAWFTQYPKMNMIVEKTINSFKGLVYFVFGLILSKRI